MMTIFIDTDTGTWGDIDKLVILDITPEEEEMLCNSSDSFIKDFGRDKDKLVILDIDKA